MGKIQKRWTADEELVLCRMRAKGATIKEIAKTLGRTNYSVTNKVFKMINNCAIEKKGPSGIVIKDYTHSFGFTTKKHNTLKPYKKEESRSKINYDEVARRIENGGLRNIQKTLREYAQEVGLSISTLNGAYYNESQSQVRIKDRVRTFTVVTPTCVLEGANKNTDKPVIRVSIWKRLKSLLSSLLYS